MNWLKRFGLMLLIFNLAAMAAGTGWAAPAAIQVSGTPLNFGTVKPPPSAAAMP